MSDNIGGKLSDPIGDKLWEIVNRDTGERHIDVPPLPLSEDLTKHLKNFPQKKPGLQIPMMTDDWYKLFDKAKEWYEIKQNNNKDQNLFTDRKLYEIREIELWNNYVDECEKIFNTYRIKEWKDS